MKKLKDFLYLVWMTAKKHPFWVLGLLPFLLFFTFIIITIFLGIFMKSLGGLSVLVIVLVIFGVYSLVEFIGKIEKEIRSRK